MILRVTVSLLMLSALCACSTVHVTAGSGAKTQYEKGPDQHQLSDFENNILVQRSQQNASNYNLPALNLLKVEMY